jgi:hypothetical protein
MSQRMYVVCQQLIANNIELVSATAWEGYQQAGRGVIFIDGGMVDSLETVPGNPMSYVSDQHMVENEGGWPSPDMAGVVSKYDPESEMIIVIKWRGEVGIYRLRSPIAPPVAFEHLKHIFARPESHSSELIFLDS